MVIYKEVEVKNPLYIVKLENGVVVNVYETYAEGSDGKNYRCLEKEVGYDEYEIVGWYQV